MSLSCVHYRSGGCRARHKFKIDPRFIQAKVDGVKLKDGKTRKKFFIDFSDPEIRNTEHWEVISHQTTSHKCSASFWDSVRKDFRERHTTASLTSLECEYESTLITTGLKQKGPEWLGKEINESAERQSSSRKIRRILRTAPKDKAPMDARTIENLEC